MPPLAPEEIYLGRVRWQSRKLSYLQANSMCIMCVWTDATDCKARGRSVRRVHFLTVIDPNGTLFAKEKLTGGNRCKWQLAKKKTGKLQ